MIQATLIETNVEPSSYSGETALYRLDPPYQHEDSFIEVEYIVTSTATIPADHAYLDDAPDAKHDVALIATDSSGTPDMFATLINELFEQHVLDGTPEQALALIGAEVAK